MSHYVDLNSDLGESFGNYTLGMDSEVLNHVTSANVACGWHAGADRIQAIKRSVSIRADGAGLGIAFGFSRKAWDYLFPNAPVP